MPEVRQRHGALDRKRYSEPRATSQLGKVMTTTSRACVSKPDKHEMFATFAELEAYFESLPESEATLEFTSERAESEDGLASVCGMKRDGVVVKVVVSDAWLMAQEQERLARN